LEMPSHQVVGSLHFAAQWAGVVHTTGKVVHTTGKVVHTTGKARRLYSYLPGCNSQLYNLLPQPGSKQSGVTG
jgi:hypothetical protein